jgi:hypothetical protein
LRTDDNHNCSSVVVKQTALRIYCETARSRNNTKINRHSRVREYDEPPRDFDSRASLEMAVGRINAARTNAAIATALRRPACAGKNISPRNFPHCAYPMTLFFRPAAIPRSCKTPPRQFSRVITSRRSGRPISGHRARHYPALCNFRCNCRTCRSVRSSDIRAVSIVIDRAHARKGSRASSREGQLSLTSSLEIDRATLIQRLQRILRLRGN